MSRDCNDPEFQGGNAGLADCDLDAIQQAHLEFILRPYENFNLQKRARCRQRDELRRQRRHRPNYLRQRVSVHDPCSPEGRRRDAPEGPIIAKEQSHIVHEELQALPPRDAEILTLMYFEEQSPKQIAERLGTKTGFVYTRLYRLLRMLRSNHRLRDQF
jgi:RNA polymerase sigma factor (sigma-70 family)